MTDDDLYALHVATMRSYEAYVAAKRGDGLPGHSRVSMTKVRAARTVWLGDLSKLTKAASPEDLRGMLLRRLQTRKGVRRAT